MLKEFLLATVLLSPTLAVADDLFNNSWYLGDKVLTVTPHAPVRNGYDHTLSYVLPDNISSSTDECSLTSPTEMLCSTNESVSINKDKHTATLKYYKGSIVYYEKGHLPEGSPLSGTWRLKGGCEKGGSALISVPHANLDETVFNHVRIEENGGYSNDNIRYLANDRDNGRLYFGPYPKNSRMGSIGGYYLYDANNNAINDISKVGTLTKLVDVYYSSCVFMKF